MIKTFILPELGKHCPQIALGQIQCIVKNSLHNNILWNEIEDQQLYIRNSFNFDTIKEQPNIKATREVYKKCGKDPHRYRPSAESLYRRIIKENDLYKVNTIVDIINLLSLKTGYSIGAFDVDSISGNLTAGVGRKDEPYEGIGRGILNIERMPVLRDETGGIGTPTSDEIRTAINLQTEHLFVNINGYTGEGSLTEVMDLCMSYLKKYCEASKVEKKVVLYKNI